MDVHHPLHNVLNRHYDYQTRMWTSRGLARLDGDPADAGTRLLPPPPTGAAAGTCTAVGSGSRDASGFTGEARTVLDLELLAGDPTSRAPGDGEACPSPRCCGDG